MKPSRAQGLSAVQSEAIPVDAVVPASGPQKVVEGLVAVGVPLGEALRSCAKELGLEGAIRLSGELATSGVERMRALYEFQRGQNKAAFGRACVKAGIHPAGVALSVITYNLNQKAEPEDLQEAKRLIRAFGVSIWLENRLDQYELNLEAKHVARIKTPVFVVPCNLKLKDVDGLSVPWLTEVNGWLDVMESKDLSFPSLVEIGQHVGAGKCERLDLPRLLSLGEHLYAVEAKNMTLPCLKTVGGFVNAGLSQNLNLPALESVGRFLNAEESRDLAMPLLERVDHELTAKFSSGLVIPMLKSVNGKPWEGLP